MPNNSSIVQEYSQVFYEESSPEKILEGFRSLRQLQSEGKLTRTELLEAEFYGYKSLKTILTESEESERAKDIIMSRLLPECLDEIDVEKSLIIRYRKFVQGWIYQYQGEIRKEILAGILDDLSAKLIKGPSRPTLSMLSVLGFRDDRIIDTIWSLVKSNDDDLGDHALSTLTWLGLPPEKQVDVVYELHIRAQNRYNQHLLWAIARVGNQGSIEIILNHWFSMDRRVDLEVDPALVFTAIREILDNYDDDISLQDATWQQLTGIVENEPIDLFWNFDIGHIPSKCNSSLVIPTMFRWMEEDDWFSQPDWARYLMGNRLGECIKPQQLRGWSKIESQVTFKKLQEDACMDTNFDGFASTQKQIVKEEAWETLLRAGYRDTLNWFNPAVTGESGRFVQKKIMDLLSCFRFDPLPEKAVQWVIEKYDDSKDKRDAREFSRRMAATQLLRSSATPSAFESLMNFGFTHEGQVMLQSTNALAEVALFMVRDENNSVVKELVDTLLHGSEYRHRLIAANALEEIAGREPTQVEPYADSLNTVVLDETREPIERGTVIRCLGHLTNLEIPEILLDKFVVWSGEPERWIGGGSLYALANHGLLQKESPIMLSVLGLEQRDGIWYLIAGDFSFEWAPYIIGLLYYREPVLFSTAVVSILEDANWQIATQIIRWIHATHKEQTKQGVFDPIIDALIQRAITKQSVVYCETEIFELLAEIAPDKLADVEWKDVLDNWMPDARVALADALGIAEPSEAGRGNCLQALEILATDSFYAVRRAAYRSIAKQSQEYLYQLCDSWGEAILLELNLRAAEACGWLDEVIEDEKGFSLIYQKEVTHPERQVRDAAQRSWEERRKRFWARQYLQIVADVHGKDNQEILGSWCYGDALGQVGDDEIKKELIAHAGKEDLPPNVRHWLRRIIKNLEQNWKKITQKWPDPWVDVKGTIESGKGKVIASKKEFEIDYSIWQQPATSPSEKHSWGGVLLSSSFSNYLGLDRVKIVFSDGREGDIILSGFTGGTATFLGTGYYPGRAPKTS